MTPTAVALLLARSAPALTLGAFIGALAWLLGMARIRGAAAAAVVVALAVAVGDRPFAVLIAGALLACGAAAWGPMGAAEPRRLRARDVASIALLACALEATTLTAPTSAYRPGAAVAALIAGTMAWLALALSDRATGPKYRLLTLRPNPNARIGAWPLMVAIVAGGVLAVGAQVSWLLAPGDAGGHVLASLVALALSTDPAVPGGRATRVAAASGCGALLAVSLMVLLP